MNHAYPPKSEWGDGPWQTEPDREEFEHAGLACLALRNHWGAWCGYVGVPPGHPAHGKPYDDASVDVHGGLRWANESDPPLRGATGDNLWWFGFDCGHFMDLSPGMVAFERSQEYLAPLLRRKEAYCNDVYRDLEYCKKEIRSLAEQLALIAMAAK